VLELHAWILDRHPDRRIVLEGHADKRGTREHNAVLAGRPVD
jgi:outer membrane protein OmpA-like peptidoglycan-associated protein